MANIELSKQSPEIYSTWPCNVCGRKQLFEVPGFHQFRRVASDCRPWPAGGKMSVCNYCGAVQKIADEDFQREIDEIYGTYTVYHQSDGKEQAVFNQNSGTSSVRSQRMLDEISARITLPQQGRLLDVGCGTGVMLRAFNAFRPQWSIAGAELNDRNRAIVESIPRCEKLYTVSPSLIPGEFNIITMVHSLEHIIGPIEFLKMLGRKLAPDGLLVVQVPNLPQSPFEVVVADHTMHFTGTSLQALVRGAGFEILHFSDKWVDKELSLVARLSSMPAPEIPAQPDEVQRSLVDVQRSFRWLSATVQQGRQLLAQGPLGLFGTSIAATWLSAELENKQAYFVDEDLSRAGKTFMGKPILTPSQVPQGGRVLIGLLPKIADNIGRRLQRPGVDFIQPSQMQ
jgi:SAM-dependent methyltransferase